LPFVLITHQPRVHISIRLPNVNGLSEKSLAEGYFRGNAGENLAAGRVSIPQGRQIAGAG
jgi:hypothetical protein